MRNGLVRLPKGQVSARQRRMSRQQCRAAVYRLLQEGQSFGGLLGFQEDVTEVVIQLGRFRVRPEQLLEKLASTNQIDRLEKRNSELLFDVGVIGRESKGRFPVLCRFNI